jgi:hypothetical protein
MNVLGRRSRTVGEGGDGGGLGKFLNKAGLSKNSPGSAAETSLDVDGTCHSGGPAKARIPVHPREPCVAATRPTIGFLTRTGGILRLDTHAI